jgi:hypothetical protein
VLPSTTQMDKLPTELLRECFELAFDRRYSTPHSITYSTDDDANIALQQHAYTLALSISSTCKRFRAAMMPMIYSRVQLIPPLRYIPQERDDLVPKRFLRTMNTSPAIREHIESLGISMLYFSQFSLPSGIEGSDFPRLSKVSLALTHDWSTREWEACCNNLRNLPVLSDLHVDLRNLKQYKGDFRPFYHILGQLPHLSITSLIG